MADRYLLESGSPDGYLLEDGTGVLLLDAWPLASTLTDNFDDNSQAAAWGQGQLKSASTVTTGVTVSETNQRLEVTPNSGSGTQAYSGYLSAGSYSLLNDSAFVKISHSAAIPTNQETFLGFGDSQNAYIAIINDTACFLQLVKAGVGFSNSSTFAYSSTTHAWLRMRYDGTSLYLDTATSSASDPPVSGDWTNQITLTPDAAVNLLGGKIALNSGTITSATPATARFDGFNTATTATVAHSLTCTTGAFTLSGQAMTPAVTMSAATGTFTLTGTAATLAVTISASTGTFVLTGNAALLKAARIFSLATGTFTLTGNAASLAVGMSAVTGLFVLAGQSATLAASMPAVTGAFILTGNSATLAVRMTAAVGAFALVGNPATLKVGHVLSLSTASFALTGNAATLALGAPLTTGAFALSGQPATLAVTMPALTGSFALTGIAATLTKTGANSITAVTASFALTGYAASLLAARRLAAIAASFSLTGSAASLGVTVPMGAGAFALTGYPGIFKRALIFSAAGQTFVLRGFDAILDHEGKSVTYPLAGIPQPYPGTPASYPLTTAQSYPLTQAQTYPLEGIPQQYPLAS